MKITALAIPAVFTTLLLAACGGDDDSGSTTGSATGTATNAATGSGEAASVTPGPTVAGLDPADFSTTIDNPLAPLSLRTVLIYEGEEIDTDTGETILMRGEMNVLPQTDIVAGVEVLVVRDEAFEDGVLVESTLDYFAQHTNGDVYYFGERVDNYEGGVIKDHNGSWLAGEGENKPGIFMPAEVTEGLVFEQEQAPGIAEDRSTVIAVGQEVTVPAGTFTDCIETEDENPLDGATETKFYCPGVGFVREEFDGGQLELILY